MLYVTYKDTGLTEIVTLEEAKILKEKNLITIPEDDGKALTKEDVYGTT